MKSALSLFSFAFLAAYSIGQPMTLQEAVEIAQRNAFEVLAAKADARASAAAADEARVALWPKVDGSITYVRFTDEITVAFDPMEPPIVVRPIDQTTFGLSIKQKLDIFGAASAAWTGIRALRMASDALVVNAVHNAGARAKAAFFQVLRAEGLEGVAKERVANVNEQLGVAKKRFEAGTAPGFDIVRFESELASAQQEELQAANEVALAKSAFNEVLARDIEAPVQLTPPDAPPAPTSDLAQLTETAKKNRGDLLAAERRWEYQRRVAQARGRAHLPTLDLTGTYSRDVEAAGFGSQTENVSATAVLSFPLFDAGANRARWRQAKAEEDKAKVSYNQTKLAVERDVQQAFLNVRSAQKVLESAEKGLVLAKESLRLAGVRYEAGVGTPVEMSDANLQFARARTAHVNALYAYWDAIANLQRAVAKEDI